MELTTYRPSQADRGLGKGSEKEAGRVTSSHIPQPLPSMSRREAIDFIVYWLRQGPRSTPISPPVGRLTSPGLYQASTSPLNRFVLHVTAEYVVFQDNSTGRFYSQTLYGFERDVTHIIAVYGRSAQGARGMVLLAEIEMEFLAGVLTTLPLGGGVSVGHVMLAITFLRLGSTIHRRWSIILPALNHIRDAHNWMRQHAPTTYRYIRRNLIVQVGRRFPDALDARAIARIAGTFVGNLGTGALLAETRLLYIFLSALRRALPAIPVQAVGGARRQVQRSVQQIRQHAQQIQQQFQAQGMAIAMDTALEIARESLSNPDVTTYVNEFMNGLQVIAGLADSIQQDVIAAGSGAP